MYLLNSFKIGINSKLINEVSNDLKKIAVKSYIRKGKIVQQSNRLIKKKTNKKIDLTIKKEIKKEINKKRLNMFNTEYSNRLNSIHKEEIRNWNKRIMNMDRKKINITDWDDSRSVMEYIEEDIKKYPNSFRSISHEGKVMAMATVEEDKINKCLKVRNLLSNPARLEGEDISGAGITSIIHMIEESIELGYEGKLKLTALPKAAKFYEKLGFKRIGSEYNFSYILEKEKAEELINNHFINNFSNNNKNIKEAYELEKDIYVFAINKK